MKKSESIFLAAIVFLVAGAAVLVYGIFSFDAARHSLGNAIGKLFTGGSQRESTAIVEMIGGGAGVLIGLVLLFARGRKVRR
jgi:hypothetical protein